jgi:hypothetical protein
VVSGPPGRKVTGTRSVVPWQSRFPLVKTSKAKSQVDRICGSLGTRCRFEAAGPSRPKGHGDQICGQAERPWGPDLWFSGQANQISSGQDDLFAKSKGHDDDVFDQKRKLL